MIGRVAGQGKKTQAHVHRQAVQAGSAGQQAGRSRQSKAGRRTDRKTDRETDQQTD